MHSDAKLYTPDLMSNPSHTAEAFASDLIITMQSWVPRVAHDYLPSRPHSET